MFLLSVRGLICHKMIQLILLKETKTHPYFLQVGLQEKRLIYDSVSRL